MTEAQRFYRLPLALGVLGGGAAVAAVVLALTRLSFDAPPFAGIGPFCKKLLLPYPGVGGVITVLAATVGVLVLLRAARSVVRQLRAQRRFLGELSTLGSARIVGADVTRLRSDLPLAFCAGLLAPRIYLSTAAEALLAPRELDAVIAHERHHQRRRDPLRLLVVRTLAEALFFMPVLRHLGERYGALAEMAADEAAVRRTDRGTLAGALLSFGELRSPAVVMGIDPQRVDHLLGRPARWEMPVSVLAGSLVTLGALVGILVTSAALNAGGSVDVTVFAARSCMALMAALPLAVLLLALSHWRPLVPARRGA